MKKLLVDRQRLNISEITNEHLREGTVFFAPVEGGIAEVEVASVDADTVVFNVWLETREDKREPLGTITFDVDEVYEAIEKRGGEDTLEHFLREWIFVKEAEHNIERIEMIAEKELEEGLYVDEISVDDFKGGISFNLYVVEDWQGRFFRSPALKAFAVDTKVENGQVKSVTPETARPYLEKHLPALIEEFVGKISAQTPSL